MSSGCMRVLGSVYAVMCSAHFPHFSVNLRSKQLIPLYTFLMALSISFDFQVLHLVPLTRACCGHTLIRMHHDINAFGNVVKLKLFCQGFGTTERRLDPCQTSHQSSFSTSCGRSLVHLLKCGRQKSHSDRPSQCGRFTDCPSLSAGDFA